MAAEVSFEHRLVAVLIPTPIQAFLSIILAGLLLEAGNTRQILPLLGVSDDAANATYVISNNLFGRILDSQIASSTALITFWASVGLIAYLVCWAAYNILIQARNEVTLETQYTNRGHWRGPVETLGLKAAGAVGFVIVVALIRPGFHLWSNLAQGLSQSFTLVHVLSAAGAVIGLAAQIYLVLAFVIFALTPWYRPEAFTDAN